MPKNPPITRTPYVPPTLEGRVTGTLVRHGPMTLADLHAALDDPADAVAEAVDELERKGWLNVAGDQIILKTPRERYERQVELHDGRMVGSWSTEWNAECEARHVARLPTQNQRHAYILRVRVGDGDVGRIKGRGDAAANALENRARAIFKKGLEEAKLLTEWCG